jgi:hypothetical protein
MNIEILGVLAVFGLFFAALCFGLLWLSWRRFRLIAVAIPAGSDTQALRFRLTEVIRSVGFGAGTRPGPSGTFRARPWLRWMVGLQDISVSEAGNGAILTGPALGVAHIGRVFAGATRQAYDGRQPVWPLAKGCLRMFASGIILLAACFLAAYLSGVR